MYNTIKGIKIEYKGYPYHSLTELELEKIKIHNIPITQKKTIKIIKKKSIFNYKKFK